MIELKTENGIAIVTIRHGKANALDVELCEGLAKCFEELRSSDARAVVMTGQGRMFSAGVDLPRLRAGRTMFASSCRHCIGSTTPRSSIRSRSWRRSTAMPSPAAACSRAVPTGASWRALAAASA